MLAGKRILVIEDNEQNLELVEFLLDEAGATVLAAADADEAREALAQEQPDLILMDMQLPGTDGLSLVSEIRRRPEIRQIPIVALTAHAMRGDRERFLAGGCDGYLAKPINVVTFVQDLSSLLTTKDPDGK
jgi:two-component system cell cycle response regulator DivK